MCFGNQMLKILFLGSTKLRKQLQLQLVLKKREAPWSFVLKAHSRWWHLLKGNWKTCYCNFCLLPISLSISLSNQISFTFRHFRLTDWLPGQDFKTKILFQSYIKMEEEEEEVANINQVGPRINLLLLLFFFYLVNYQLQVRQKKKKIE